MSSKIKEFKGSLNPIFDKSTVNNNYDEEKTSKQLPKIYLPINRIKQKENQPRKYFNEEALNNLAESIKSKGIIQPIIVRPIDNGFYEIVVGERRWRASKQLGLDEIPAIIRDYDKYDSMSISLIENIQRENLNTLEEAEAIQKLLEEYSMTHTQVAECIGKSRTAVSNLLRLLKLEPQVKNMVSSSNLEMGHARALLGLSGQLQIDAANKIIEQTLSVRETEKFIKKITNSISVKNFHLDPAFENKRNYWEKTISGVLTSKVNVKLNSKGKGKIVIHFDSIEKADSLFHYITKLKK